MNKDIMTIKKTGTLVALEPKWSYWVMNDIMYAVHVTGTRFSVWCDVSRLNAHLHRLYQAEGHRFFTDDPAMVIINRPFISQFRYA